MVNFIVQSADNDFLFSTMKFAIGQSNLVIVLEFHHGSAVFA